MATNRCREGVFASAFDSEVHAVTAPLRKALAARYAVFGGDDRTERHVSGEEVFAKRGKA